MTDLPEGWRIEYISATDGRVIVDVDDEGDVCIEWDERCDDAFGTTTRRVTVPLSVIMALAARAEVTL